MRISKTKINPILEDEFLNTFAQLIVDLDKLEEARLFLVDFLKHSELITITKRLAVGYWLAKKRSYANIRNNIKVSSATIADISRMTKKQGFRIALKKVEAEEWASKWTKRVNKVIKLLS